MFDELTDKLGNVFAKLRGRGVLTEADIKDGMREVRRVLLEADVNFALTREFLEKVEKKAIGVLQLKQVQPAQQLVKIVHDELTAMLGERREALKMSSVPPTVVIATCIAPCFLALLYTPLNRYPLTLRNWPKGQPQTRRFSLTSWPCQTRQGRRFFM